MTALRNWDAETRRIVEEYHRRAASIGGSLYAPWKPDALFGLSTRRRVAAELLHKLRVFPRKSSQCLEVGYGSMGWMADLIGWGVPERNIHGIELIDDRATKARESLPLADLRTGNAATLPWDDNVFDLVIMSIVLTSVYDDSLRIEIAHEVERVTKPGGAMLWYDFKVDNPFNPNVRKVTRADLKTLFPNFGGRIRSVTLAPPIARAVVPWSWNLATLLESIPILRTHLLGVLVNKKAVLDA